MKSKRFYLACLRDTVGNNVAFHGKNGRGYTSDIDKAECYSLESAQKAWNGGREFDIPLCADRVDELAVYHVDCQLLPCDSEGEPVAGKYVAFKKRKWNGNDVFWLGEDGEFTDDFSKAKVFENAGINEDLVWVPFVMANAAKRRTFCVDLINRRKMTQAAGLRLPDHIKKFQKRKTSGKERWNCPSCGKISWQFDPHEFNGCRDMNCDEWKPVYAGDIGVVT